jgi:hypothetical protein
MIKTSLRTNISSCAKDNEFVYHSTKHCETTDSTLVDVLPQGNPFAVAITKLNLRTVHSSANTFGEM